MSDHRPAARRARLALLGVLAGLLSAACNPLAFFDIRDQAPTVALESPNDYEGGTFGAVLAPIAATDRSSGLPISRVLVGGGPGSPFVYYPVAFGDDFQLDISNLLRGCFPDDTCPGGIGASLAGTARARMDGAEQFGCFIAPAPGQVQTWCESLSGWVSWPAPTTTDFGEASYGLPEGHVLGIALVSAPGEVSEEGRLFRIFDDGRPEVIEPSVPISELAAGDRLGHRMALVAPDRERVWVATTAPGDGSAPTVYLLELDASAGPLETRTRACVRMAGVEAFGEALALGDVNGDGAPELFVGGGPDVGPEEVYVYDGAALPADAGADCSAEWPLARTLRCPADTEVGCDASDFGVALAVGDFDGDALGDLLVGAPGARVGDVAEAGGGFVFAGSAAGVSELGAEAVAVRHSSPEFGDRLGQAVTAVRGPTGGAAQRDEAVLAAPGRAHVELFTCTGLSGDRPDDFPNTRRCRPE